jgi:WD40 repeat protein
VFPPDGKKVVTSGEVAVRIWDADSGKELRLLRQEEWEPKVLNSALFSDSGEPKFGLATFSPDGTKILAVCRGIFRIWDAESGKELQRSEGYGFGGPGDFAAFTPDGKKIVTTVYPLTWTPTTEGYTTSNGGWYRATPPPPEQPVQHEPQNWLQGIDKDAIRLDAMGSPFSGQSEHINELEEQP